MIKHYFSLGMGAFSGSYLKGICKNELLVEDCSYNKLPHKGHIVLGFIDISESGPEKGIELSCIEHDCLHFPSFFEHLESS